MGREDATGRGASQTSHCVAEGLLIRVQDRQSHSFPAAFELGGIGPAEGAPPREELGFEEPARVGCTSLTMMTSSSESSPDVIFPFASLGALEGVPDSSVSEIQSGSQYSSRLRSMTSFVKPSRDALSDSCWIVAADC